MQIGTHIAAPRAAVADNGTLAHAAVALAVVCWSGSNVLIKVVSASGLVSSFYRLWLAIPLLWLGVLVTRP